MNIKYKEPDYSTSLYTQKSTRKPIKRILEILSNWLEDLNSNSNISNAKKTDIKNRLENKKYEEQSIPAFLELFCYQLMRKFQCSMVIEEKAENGKAPDLKVTLQNGKTFFLEATCCSNKNIDEIRKRLSEKAKKYGEMDKPFIIALNLSDETLDIYDVKEIKEYSRQKYKDFFTNNKNVNGILVFFDLRYSAMMQDRHRKEYGLYIVNPQANLKFDHSIFLSLCKPRPLEERTLCERVGF